MTDTVMIDTVRDALGYGGAETAIVDIDGATVTFEALRWQVDRLGAEFAGCDIGPGDRIAIVVPNGPVAAIGFLAAASYAAAAPLIPKYRESEFAFYLEDLKPALMIVTDDTSEAALAAAEESGVPVASMSGVLGSMTLGVEAEAGVIRRPGPAEPGLFLHTSGTTSRPKLVPILQRNLARSAANIATSLMLEPADRSLNVMPLFHIHGLLAGLLAPLSVGASVVATPGFDAFAFFRLLETFAPTYYTAVPTMHQMVIDRAKRRSERLDCPGLRFIRSSSAALPAQVLVDLEGLFGVPVIEAYGMTEATHQMCTNPLPPGQRKIRSVGLPTGIELSVIDADANAVPVGQAGPIAIRGATVVRGYEANSEATRAAFIGDWFLTGDQGYLDEDGYLFLTGRLKELINRGGEKISPLEVDDALLNHPAVAQAVTFAVPHAKLGEDVAAGVVLEPGAEIDERELTEFVGTRLAAFKVPRTIVFLDELPKGPTGKLQRIGLSERLGIGPW